MFFIFHVGVIHFFRSFISFLRSFISFLRRIFYSPRGNFEISTWKSLFPDTTPQRYVFGSKLLQQASIELTLFFFAIGCWLLTVSYWLGALVLVLLASNL